MMGNQETNHDRSSADLRRRDPNAWPERNAMGIGNPAAQHYAWDRICAD
jgi:hypothetical protein